jgi:hypothetical protein
MLQPSKIPAPPAKRSRAPFIAIALAVGGITLAAVLAFGKPFRVHDDNIAMGQLAGAAGLVGFFWYAVLRVMGRA